MTATRTLLLALVSLGACTIVEPREPAACTETAEHETRRSARLGWSRLSPVFVDGELHGQRVVDLDPRTALAAAGIRPGDTIVEVSGTRIDTPEASEWLWCKLGAIEPLELEIERARDSRHRIHMAGL